MLGSTPSGSESTFIAMVEDEERKNPPFLGLSIEIHDRSATYPIDQFATCSQKKPETIVKSCRKL
jgi:hypothetical protein